MRHPPADLTPPTIAALAAALAEARRVRIIGTQSLASRTPPPPPNALTVSTAALTELQIEPLDLIARVQAGVKLAGLRQRLWEHGVVWPVERLEPGGTVGGLIASGRGSAVRVLDGPARRWLLGATVVLASGETIHIGGATVKFSAGYGLTHAMWGSAGRLGALAEVTLRLRHAVPGDSTSAGPRPEVRQVLESPHEVRAAELPSGWREAEWEAIAPAMPRVVSVDGARALVGCPDRDAANAVTAAIRGRGGWAAIDRPASTPPPSEAWEPLGDALDPERRLV
ncbi:MAG: FAD-binding oxidoreductase [Chloroflexi bacterium]|nr:FAD-binding oxidoreductase [Chloroflexota bacterium]